MIENIDELLDLRNKFDAQKIEAEVEMENYKDRNKNLWWVQRNVLELCKIILQCEHEIKTIDKKIRRIQTFIAA